MVVHKCCDHTTKSEETLKKDNDNENKNKNKNENGKKHEMVNKMEKMWRVNEEK